MAGGINLYQYAPNALGWVDLRGLSRKCSGSGSKNSNPDFYVGPDGPSATMRSTAYRYARHLNDDGSMDKWAADLIATKKAPVTYFGFDEFDTGSGERNIFQIKGVDKVDPLIPADKSWSNARLRGKFDTLQLYENGVPQARQPAMYGDNPGAPPEPFTKAYPEYGDGAVQQMHADKRVITFDEVDILPEKKWIIIVIMRFLII